MADFGGIKNQFADQLDNYLSFLTYERRRRRMKPFWTALPRRPRDEVERKYLRAKCVKSEVMFHAERLRARDRRKSKLFSGNRGGIPSVKVTLEASSDIGSLLDISALPS
ncbi:hypothetical protein PV326_011352 [Microctonus aethiopoides]|nr:hypothetical protein PV326_011352 [Microctonus aethiopoides]